MTTFTEIDPITRVAMMTKDEGGVAAGTLVRVEEVIDAEVVISVFVGSESCRRYSVVSLSSVEEI
jgi:hypothetical protein